jgi:hypothetical protein
VTELEAEELNRVLENRLRALQEIDIARQDDLTFRDADGLIRRLSPKKRLFLTLEALETQLALEDISTFRMAAGQIAEVAEGFAGARVQVIPLEPESPDLGVPEEPIDFESLPDLSDLRARLRAIAERIQFDSEA